MLLLKKKELIKSDFDVDDIYEIEEGYEIKLEKKDEEIERLNRTNNEIFKANETLAEEIKKLQNQLQQKENIIKEVREYIEEWQRFPHTNGSTHKELKNLIDILDKEVN